MKDKRITQSEFYSGQTPLETANMITLSFASARLGMNFEQVLALCTSDELSSVPMLTNTFGDAPTVVSLEAPLPEDGAQTVVVAAP